MYTPLLLAAIMFVISLITAYFSRSKNNKDSGANPTTLRKVLSNAAFEASMAASFGAVVATLLVGNMAPRKDVEGEPSTLVAMRNVEGASGAFILGTGAVGSDAFFTFFVRNDDGSLTPGRVSAADHVRIIEDKGLSGVGYWTTVYSVYDQDSKWGPWGVDLIGRTRVKSYVFRVPVGTVVQSFRVQ